MPDTKPAKRINRVQLPTQRVKPSTKAKLQRLRGPHKGIGRALDFCVEGARE